MKWQVPIPLTLSILDSSDVASVSHLGIIPKFPLSLITGKFILDSIGSFFIFWSVTSDIQALIFEVGESLTEKSEENFYMDLLV